MRKAEGDDEVASGEDNGGQESESDTSSQRRTISECSAEEECAAGALMALTTSFRQTKRSRKRKSLEIDTGAAQTSKPKKVPASKREIDSTSPCVLPSVAPCVLSLLLHSVGVLLYPACQADERAQVRAPAPKNAQ